METENSSDSSNDEVDRISKLTETLIHHILSFIDFKYAIQTCVLSKRWRYVWTSLPALNFDSKLYFSGRTCDHKRVLDFVDNVLTLRDSRGSDIQKFHLVCGPFYSRADDFWTSRLHRWIIHVVKANVEDINVHYDSKAVFKVPDCVFMCKSLKSLVLDISCRIILPNSLCLVRLKYLKLKDSSLNNEEQIQKLLSSCPVLEHLELSDVSSNGHINISISSLTLKHFGLHIKYNKLCHNKLRLSAPNLLSFASSSLDFVLLDNVSSLLAADTDVQVKPRNADFPVAYTWQGLEFLEVLCNVKDLTISFLPVEAKLDVRRIPELLQNQPFQFSNLLHFKLRKMSLSPHSMRAIASLLKIMPCIESFTLELPQDRNINEYSDDDESDEGSDSDSDLEPEFEPDNDVLTLSLEESSSTYTLKHLKSVEISGLKGSDFELEFIGILLKNAMLLERMVLHHCKPRSSRDKYFYKDNVKKFHQKVMRFPSASLSSKVAFYFFS
ncbi:hypothetical protein MKW92_020292 [Papaver armeniacum]|nr:hypothetical protein MKW92_020292 [Papaver armeniacum]